MAKTKPVCTYLPRLAELMSEAGWRRPEELAAASGLSYGGCRLLLMGSYQTMQHATAVALAITFSKKIGREVTADWIRGLE